MAQVGQTTPTGGRQLIIYEDQAAMSRLTVPVGCTVNFVGVFCGESATPNENSLKAFIYTTAGVLLYTSNILANAITTVNPTLTYNAMVTFTGATLSAGSYDFVVAATGLGGTPIVNGQTGPGGTPVILQSTGMYATPPNPYTGGTVDSSATRTWDIYVDYTATAGGSIPVIQGRRILMLNN